VFTGFLWGKLEGKTPRRRWAYNIKVDLTAIGWKVTDWINVTQDWDKLRAAMNTWGNFSFANMQGIS
jgi:hypothetical protein